VDLESCRHPLDRADVAEPPQMDCIEYRKLKGHAAAAESPVGTYLFSHSAGASWFINRIDAETLRVFHSPHWRLLEKIQSSFPPLSPLLPRKKESPRTPPPPATGTAPERMRVKTPCSWRMQASPSKGVDAKSAPYVKHTASRTS
jgi:hypothetical protein